MFIWTTSRNKSKLKSQKTEQVIIWSILIIYFFIGDMNKKVKHDELKCFWSNKICFLFYILNPNVAAVTPDVQRRRQSSDKRLKKCCFIESGTSKHKFLYLKFLSDEASCCSEVRNVSGSWFSSWSLLLRTFKYLCFCYCFHLRLTHTLL